MRSIIVVCLVIYCISNETLGQKSLKYLNQEQPGLIPKIFAPGLVSLKDRYEFGSVFSKDGKEFYYAFNIGKRAEIWLMKLAANNTPTSERLIFHEHYSYNDPYLSPDETKLFFI